MSKREGLQKYRKTKKGVISDIYFGQISSSKHRGHALPTYSKKWFSNWLLNNPEFHRLYDMWVLSKYEKNFKPSVDRKRDELSYTEYNIQLLTWKENNLKRKMVIQLDLNGKYIADYKSLSEACRKNNISNSGSISDVCKGHRKSAGGFIWKFKDN